VADPGEWPTWLAALEAGAPDAVAAWRNIADGRPIGVRREVRQRAGEGSVARVLAQHEAIADEYGALIAALPEDAFRLPGGESDWNVAQALGHAFAARDGLVTAASLAAAGRFPADPPRVVPSVPGSPDATRQELARRLALSRRIVARAARSIAGHELDDCPLDHPLVGHLRCGEWFLFIAVHDLMHLEQLADLAASLRAEAPRAAGAP
jgi:hypothetical protein